MNLLVTTERPSSPFPPQGMDALASHRRSLALPYDATALGKISSCGGMIGTALLFPSAYAGNAVSPALTLAIFITSVGVFGSLHHKPVAGVGPYVAVGSAILLLCIVLSGGSSVTSQITPWLPLYVATACLFTPLIHAWMPGIHAWITDLWPIAAASHAALESLPPLATSRGSDPGRSEWMASPEPYPDHPNAIQHMGPSSHYSRGTGSPGTTISLGNVIGASRDPQAGRFILGNAYDDQPGTSPLNPYDAAHHLEEGRVPASDYTIATSRDPLLGDSHD